MRRPWPKRDLGSRILLIAVLALSLAAVISVAVVARDVLRSPSLFDRPDQLVVVWKADPSEGAPYVEVAVPEIHAWRDRLTQAVDVAAYGAANQSGVMALDGEALSVRLNEVSVSFFETLGVEPVLGRGFADEDEAPSSDRVMVLSYELWQRLFAGSESVLGRTVSFQQQRFEPRTIVGVMPAGLDFPRGVELWIPIRREGYHLAENVRYSFGLVRRGVDASREQLEAELEVVSGAWFAARDAGPSDESIVLTPFTDLYLGVDTKRAVWAIAVAAILLLVLAWVNASNVQLSRHLDLEGDYQIRRAIGATDGDVVRLVLRDGLSLGVVSSLVAAGLAHFALAVLTRVGPTDVPGLGGVALSWSAVSWLGCLSLASGVVVSVLPSLFLLAGRRGSLPLDQRVRSAFSSRRWLVAVQSGLAIVLVVGAGLTLRSFQRLLRDDTGYDVVRKLVLDVQARNELYPDIETKRDFFRRAIERIETLPGVTSAAGIVNRPFLHGSAGWDFSFLREDQSIQWTIRSVDGRDRYFPDRAAWDDNPTLNWEAVSVGYFETMGIELLEGRDFSAVDDASRPPVIIVGESLASRVWPNQSPLGRKLLVPAVGGFGDDGRPIWSRVIGVVEDAKYREIDGTRFDLYAHHLQAEVPLRSLVVRTAVEPSVLMAPIREELRRMDARTPVSAASTMEQIVRREQAPWRFQTMLFGAFGLVGLGVCALGMFGVVVHAVSARRREIGLRLALGARPRGVVSLMLRVGLVPSLVGLSVGAGLATLLSRSLDALLFESGSPDLVAYVAAVGLLALVALAACYLPASRAATIDPAELLRAE